MECGCDLCAKHAHVLLSFDLELVNELVGDVAESFIVGLHISSLPMCFSGAVVQVHSEGGELLVEDALESSITVQPNLFWKSSPICPHLGEGVLGVLRLTAVDQGEDIKAACRVQDVQKVVLVTLGVVQVDKVHGQTCAFTSSAPQSS